MLPGRTYAAEDVIPVALRRKWWIIVPFVLGATIAFGVGKSLPFQYRSEALIMLMPQRVPVVRSADDSPLEARLNVLSQQILTRASLEQVILDFDLYRAQRLTIPMEEVVRRMRVYDIQIKLESGNVFRLGYVGLSPKTVQQVAERLASLFIERDMRDREVVTNDTNDFLNAELEEAKRRLVEHEAKVEEYRRQYSHQLPTQAASLTRAIENSQSQLQALGEGTKRDLERKQVLEQQLDELQSPDLIVSATGAENSTPGEAIARKLEAAETQLQSMQLRLKPDHPDIHMMQRTIRDLRTELETENRRPRPIARPSTASETSRQKRIKDLKTQIDDLNRQSQAKGAQEERLRATIAEQQANLDAVPRRESELVELNRDYGTLQNTYWNLLGKRQEWKITTSLERRSLGDQFKVLEPARESERPIGPNRFAVYLIGTAASLVVGLLLGGFVEYMDSSFRSEADIEKALKLVVLASIPVMSSDLKASLLRRRA